MNKKADETNPGYGIGGLPYTPGDLTMRALGKYLPKPEWTSDDTASLGEAGGLLPEGDINLQKFLNENSPRLEPNPDAPGHYQYAPSKNPFMHYIVDPIANATRGHLSMAHTPGASEGAALAVRSRMLANRREQLSRWGTGVDLGVGGAAIAAAIAMAAHNAKKKKLEEQLKQSPYTPAFSQSTSKYGSLMEKASNGWGSLSGALSTVGKGLGHAYHWTTDPESTDLGSQRTSITSSPWFLPAALGGTAALTLGTYELMKRHNDAKIKEEILNRKRQAMQEYHQLLSQNPMPEDGGGLPYAVDKMASSYEENSMEKDAFASPLANAIAGGLITVSGAMALMGGIAAYKARKKALKESHPYSGLERAIVAKRMSRPSVYNQTVEDFEPLGDKPIVSEPSQFDAGRYRAVMPIGASGATPVPEDEVPEELNLRKFSHLIKTSDTTFTNGEFRPNPYFPTPSAKPTATGGSPQAFGGSPKPFEPTSSGMTPPVGTNHAAPPVTPAPVQHPVTPQPAVAPKPAPYNINNDPKMNGPEYELGNPNGVAKILQPFGDAMAKSWTGGQFNTMEEAAKTMKQLQGYGGEFEKLKNEPMFRALMSHDPHARAEAMQQWMGENVKNPEIPLTWKLPMWMGLNNHEGNMGFGSQFIQPILARLGLGNIGNMFAGGGNGQQGQNADWIQALAGAVGPQQNISPILA